MTRNEVEEFQAVRNSRAHNESFSTDDAFRGSEVAQRLLDSVATGTRATDAGMLNQESLRPRFEDQSRSSRHTAVQWTERSG